MRLEHPSMQVISLHLSINYIRRTFQKKIRCLRNEWGMCLVRILLLFGNHITMYVPRHYGVGR